MNYEAPEENIINRQIVSLRHELEGLYENYDGNIEPVQIKVKEINKWIKMWAGENQSLYDRHEHHLTKVGNNFNVAVGEIINTKPDEP